ncbi:putative transcriptional regulatory protein [Colletotrichum siamense]|nr:putative transcriptional regulatory protein [Colletotrichum siamense]
MANSQPPATSSTTTITITTNNARDAAASLQQKPPPRKRKSTPRSREGCLTCRTRRVKCDETKPKCNNCIRHQSGCTWPDPPRRGGAGAAAANVPLRPAAEQQQHLTVALRPALTTSAVKLTQKTERAFKYFQTESARQFAGYFDNDFWAVTVLQLAHAEPCVAQILVALGARHEGYRNDVVARQPDPDAVMLCRRADEEYTKALHLFKRHIHARQWTDLHVTLTCAALCIAFDWLRGTEADANIHLQTSLNTMAMWLSDTAPLAPAERAGMTPVDSPEGRFIQKALKPIFITMALHTRSLPSPPTIPVQVVSAEDGHFGPFATLTEARDGLVLLLAYIFPEFITYYTTDFYGDTTTMQKDPLGSLRRWEDALNEYLARHPEESADPRADILRLWHIGATLLFLGENNTTEGENFYDTMVPQFEYQIGLAERLIETTEIPQWRFSVDMGAISCLYHTAVKCRNPDIRRRAIALLKRWPRREAVYDSLACAALAEEIVKIEEGALREAAAAAEAAEEVVVRSEGDVPRHARISGKVWSECYRDDSGQRYNELWVRREGEAEWSEEPRRVVW